MKTTPKTTKRRSPWTWVPTLYFAEGIPYVAVMTISLIMYKRLGLSNTDITLYTSWLYLPWVIKPFWSPLVDLIKTKRWWIWAMQLLIGAALAGIAFTLNTSPTIQATLAFFWLIAFSSATHDIAAELGKVKGGRILVGFALETDDETAHAETKLASKNFDFIVLNSLRDKGAGFGVDTNKVTLIDRTSREELPLMSKQKVAARITDRIATILNR